MLSFLHEIGYTGYNAPLLKQPLAHNAAAWISNPITAAADQRTAEFEITLCMKSGVDILGQCTP